MHAHDLDLFRRDVMVRGKPPVRLSVIDAAPDHDPDRPALVFVHGFGGYALQWAFQMLAFADTWRVVSLDLRGHGLSDRPRSGYEVEILVEDLERVVEALALPASFTLIGHSFGGAVATTYAAKHPERVDRIVLIGTSVDFFTLHVGARMALSLPSTMLEPVRSLFPKRFAAPSHVLRSLYRNALSKWNGNEVFARITQPTLVIMGERDQVFDRRAYDAVPDRIPHCQVVKVSVSAHLVHLERPDAVNRAIARFIAAPVPAPAAGDAAFRHPDRPWIRHYEAGVPATLTYPLQPIHRMLDAAARRFPRRRALVFDGRAVTYETLRVATDRLANALIARNLSPGDRVAVLLGNSPALVLAHFGVHKAGGIVVSLDPTLAGEEISRQIEASGARTLITDSELLAAHPWPCPPACVREVLLASSTSNATPFVTAGLVSSRLLRRGRIRWPDGVAPEPLKATLEGAWRSAPHVALSPDDVANIEFSSGSTGRAKAVALTHRNLLANVIQIRRWFQDLEDGREVILCAVGLWHSYGVTTCMHLGVSVAATLVLPQPGIPALLRTVARYRPTIFPGSPEIYRAISTHPRVRRFDLKSIRACVSGAAPLPVEVQEVFERLTRGRLVEGYGLTEAGPITHVNPIYGLRKRGSIGIPLPDTEARIVDLETRAVLPAGRAGELEVRGPQVMKGYWDEAALTSERLRGRWLSTGDVARMDEDGFFCLLGRKGEAIRSEHGEIYPREVEEVLYESARVSEAAVSAETIAGTTRLVAHVVPRTGQSVRADELEHFCAERLPPHAVPVRFEFCEALPRSALGKLQRGKLGRSSNE